MAGKILCLYYSEFAEASDWKGRNNTVFSTITCKMYFEFYIILWLYQETWNLFNFLFIYLCPHYCILLILGHSRTSPATVQTVSLPSAQNLNQSCYIMGSSHSLHEILEQQHWRQQYKLLKCWMAAKILHFAKILTPISFYCGHCIGITMNGDKMLIWFEQAFSQKHIYVDDIYTYGYETKCFRVSLFYTQCRAKGFSVHPIPYKT